MKKKKRVSPTCDSNVTVTVVKRCQSMRSVYCRCKLPVKFGSRTIDIQLSSGRSPKYAKPNSVKNTSNATT